MIFLRKPNSATVQSFLLSETKADFTYAGVGSTASSAPPGYTVDRTRIQLGSGERTFLKARRLLETWGQFNLGWITAVPPDTPIRTGALIGVLVRSFGL